VRLLLLALITSVACATAPPRPAADGPASGPSAEERAEGPADESVRDAAQEGEAVDGTSEATAPAPATAARTPTKEAKTPKAGLGDGASEAAGVGRSDQPDAESEEMAAEDGEPEASGVQDETADDDTDPSKDEASVPVSPPPPAPSPAPGPNQPRFLLIGDSMVVAELGRDMGRTLEATFAGDVRRRGKSSSGLARPDFFDWFREGARLAEAHRPDVVVVIIGGNDGQDLVNEEGRDRIRWRTEAWPSAYAVRVHRFLDAMEAEGRRFVWVELPAMDHRNLEGKLRLIRRVQREALEDRSDVLGHVDTQGCFYDGKGRLRKVIPGGPKKGRALRQEDGIHFSLFGARWVSRCLAPQLVKLVERRVALADDQS